MSQIVLLAAIAFLLFGPVLKLRRHPPCYTLVFQCWWFPSKQLVCDLLLFAFRPKRSPDKSFYESPRFVTHIDDPAIVALTKYYSEVFPPSETPGVTILDMCSSWVSHFPAGYKQDRIVGMGMNEEELKRNQVLTEYVVQDLNVNPKLPFEDNSFDVITNVVSVDYLTKPIDVFKEMCRILKPGGLAIISLSNRCFWTKAISIWTMTTDAGHVLIVGSYFHYAGGFEPAQVTNISNLFNCTANVLSYK
ncbi:hypothetical protein TEA_002307 [Camellia sinensis var. sinensis]|uniref:Methyltransferase type 11 domain-containing protein n=1 Tax=Camellia sinensis var. sinensis TaxID=542762 RepID=A0A4S4DQC1_CAMSN|nr:hypothetical protein TEA_002307 [Camellia sinensis var. sinensis]